MKKGLSILLVAAALFGFYGSAVNLNDILACKDYWEEAGEKSTADMNKLEDGLNQLKENEQAYLDGQDQLAEGEKALADGEAQYAKGLADYEAAPGKLAAGERKLAEGESSYKQLKTLIKGLNTAKQHGVKTTKSHDTYWHDGFSYGGTKEKQYMDGGLKVTRGVIKKLLNEKKDVVNLIESNTLGTQGNLLAGINGAGENDYAAFDKAVMKVSGAFGAMSAALKQNATNAANGQALLSAGYSSLNAKSIDVNADGEPDVSAVQAMGSAPISAIRQNPQAAAVVGGIDMARANLKSLNDNIKTIGALESMSDPNMTYTQMLGSTLAVIFDDSKSLKETAEAINSASKLMPAVAAIFSQGAELVDEYDGNLKKWDSGYHTLADAKDGKGSNDLASKSEGIPFAFKNMVTNPTIKSAIKKYDKTLLKELKKYTGDRLKNDNMQKFDDDLVYISKKLIPRSLKVLSKVKADANKQLAAGRRQLAQGRADYAAAPGKLADAEQQLADGRQQLADGKAQLAQYEDGEQQIRDGLATLVGTEPDLSLESISDRLNGDTDFDNGDEHLDIDEGLAAVDVGRGYQAEDGVLITDEIMARAVGTGALLGAGALALIAAILSFLKKNKGAGVFAILAAAAGAFGAYYGTNAGTYFSDIAGSTAGNAAWMAAGILGVVALVHAIVHFTAKKEA